MASPHSSSSYTDIPFPLAKYLDLYTKAPRELYIDYFQGMRLLIDWLGKPAVSANTKDNTTVPQCFRTYELSRLALILEVPERQIFNYWLAKNCLKEM